MQDSDEITILNEDHVRITNIRTVIDLKTYQMSNIRSVRMDERESKLFAPVFFMLITAVCLALVALTNLDDLSGYLKISLYLGIGVLLFLLLSTKTKYSVRVRSSDGELNILESNDKDSVEQIVSAMRKAMSLRE